ncbi:Smc5-6 complex SMC P-loop ATPase subunit Smc6 [Schizosaccharomyces osmophilus]|uniref:Smc5-6 complex SMC P-loop ATPase subunit Smc6 n=1 Tax=Schizosaccharomyces osmophilus TaxID=2545709 RepID=A0AAE9WGR4_9SCHI|nr:Smc5-6 complex SMC P-loop ATPase subunit Smc6 [Schizosaccharomyces osmophilus]WBW75403.1 Smc5-6 complex SMC P-loop ATPase subunit Smc6 [Schizosaccharomyces osmophilus]
MSSEQEGDSLYLGNELETEFEGSTHGTRRSSSSSPEPLNAKDSKRRRIEHEQDSSIKTKALQRFASTELSRNDTIDSIGEDAFQGETQPNPQFENRVGVIESIHLINFMCHDSLRISFGSRINFVIGHNGSGKSAILTGLTVCLGAKASSTNRAPNMKSLIKQGKSFARISVTISNRGFEAYQRNVYGDSITIERTIRREGSSEYKLRGHDDTVISTKREELDSICDHMGLQIDNPMNILTQDTARQFLGNSSPKEKYQLFMKGIQLKQLEDNYSLIEQSLYHTKNALDGKKSGLLQLAKKEEECKTKWDQSRETENLHNILEKKKEEMAWALVVEVEKELLGTEEEVRAAEARVNQCHEERNSYVKKFSEFDERILVKNQAMESLKTSITETKAKFENVIKTFEAHRSEMSDVDIQKRDIQNSINAARNCLQIYKDQLASERERQNTDDVSDHQRRLDEISTLQRQIANLSEQAVELESKRNELHTTVFEKEGNLSSLLDKKDALAKQVSNQAEKIRVMEEVQRDKLTAFGKNIPYLLRLITRETRFQHPPKGPMGRFMTVKEEKWHLTIERILGNVINGFIVRTHHDQLILKELMRRANCNATVVVGRYDPFDYSLGEPVTPYSTVLQAIRFEDDEVLHTLINHLGIEKMLLIEDRKEAETYMKSGVLNVTQCYALDPRSKGFGFRIVSNQRSSGISKVTPWNRPPRIGGSGSMDSRREKEQLENLKQLYDNANNDLLAAKQEQGKYKREEQIVIEKIEVIKREILDTRRQVNALESVETSVLDTEKIQSLERKITETEKELESYVGQLQDAKDEERRIREEQRPVIDEIEMFKEKIQSENQKLALQQAEIDQIRDEKTRLEMAQEEYVNKSDHLLNEMREKEAKRIRCSQVVAEYSAKAATRCERVPVTHTPTELDNEIERLQLQITEWRNRTGISVEQAAEDYLKAKEEHDRSKLLVTKLQSLLESLEETLRKRNEMWVKFRKLITLRTKELFELYLSQRNFTGKLVIRHQDEFLEPRVYPANRNLSVSRDRQTLSQVSVQGLSGGEKSFATICMLLSIWEAMSCPLRCLDEFDVFMDAVNRLVSIRMMVDSAKDSSEKQFIFITPQDMGQIAFDDDVVVFRLSDPVKSSSALPASTAP